MAQVWVLSFWHKAEKNIDSRSVLSFIDLFLLLCSGKKSKKKNGSSLKYSLSFYVNE